MNILATIATKAAAAVVGLALTVAGLFGGMQVSPQSPQLGATIPTVVALYEDSLQSKVTSTDTSMTTVRGTDQQGVALSGFYGFIIDEGTSSQEFVVCTAAGTALTGCTRGVSVEDGKTSVAALEFSHRRGSSIKITNFPQIGILSRILNGQDTLPNRILYGSHLSFTGSAASTSLVDRYYVDNSFLSGAATADTSTKGLVQIATFAQLASGTTFGSTGAYVVPDTKDIVNSKLANHYSKVATGLTDSYAITVSGVASLSTGMEFSFLASASNVGTATLNVNSLGAKTIKNRFGNTLANRDLGPNTTEHVVYDGTNFVLVSDLSPMHDFAQDNRVWTSPTSNSPETISHSLGTIPRKVHIVAFWSNGATSKSWSDMTYDASQVGSNANFGVSMLAGGLINTHTCAYTPPGDSGGCDLLWFGNSQNNRGVASILDLTAQAIKLKFSSVGNPGGTVYFTVDFEQ